ncbi:alpha/beta hydrolase [Anaerosporobacter sp.]|uniref:alpha/beta hydrolase n=1 Tax=Anaerosporobacter sp. TaxID=1872529 RepID=UPI00286EE915|nr:alpha/beta hydrolase [Anaerosporobacter sp.]
MGRKYDSKTVESLKANAEQIDYKGLPVLLKPIPEGGEDGDMDPRVYKSMKMLPLMSKFMRKPKKEQTVLESILPMRKMFNKYSGDYIVTTGVDTIHVNVPSADGYKVPVRIYRRSIAGDNLPVFVYYHGGGFFGGHPDIVEQMCKFIVQNYDCLAFSIDYRLCPENHYPQPLDDCFYATVWARDHAAEYGGDNTRMVVSGDSAGGNLAAAVTLRDREEKTGMVKARVLFYPAVNVSGNHTEFYKGVDFAKYHRSKKHGKVLDSILKLMMGDPTDNSGGQMKMLNDVYLQGHLNPEHIYASPLLDDQHDVPPTLLIFGEHDFLVFEDFAYARTLQAAGREVKTILYRGMGHGFADQVGVSPQAEDSLLETVTFMKELFNN